MNNHYKPPIMNHYNHLTINISQSTTTNHQFFLVRRDPQFLYHNLSAFSTAIVPSPEARLAGSSHRSVLEANPEKPVGWGIKGRFRVGLG